MDKKQAKILFKKYVNSDCSPAEIELLEKFLKSYQEDNNAEPAFSKMYGSLESFNNSQWQKINTQINGTPDTNVKKLKKTTYYKYAAILVGLLLTTGFYFLNTNTAPVLTPIDTSGVTLKIGNQPTLSIETDAIAAVKDKDGKQIGTQQQNLVSHKDIARTKVEMHTMYVPFGETFKLELSDGTLVHLNAGTTFTYPSYFEKTKNRNVTVDGEAYFEVTRDKSRPFIVSTDAMEVEVLGTKFDVNTYEDDNIYTVLAEGSVRIGSKNSGTILEPGQKATLTKNILHTETVNTSNYLGWVRGELIFNNESFASITHKIERKYNVTVENKYTDLKNNKFRGTFEEETILDLLEVFKESAGFNYTIVNNNIIITKP